ncbi:MAG: PE-PPE domain-containing protein, partial [Mycobacterium sp.]
MPDSQYDVSVVFHQYEFWGDPPDRPWHLVAAVNSLFGLAYFHNNTAMAVPDDAVVVSSVKGELNGTTTTYM